MPPSRPPRAGTSVTVCCSAASRAAASMHPAPLKPQARTVACVGAVTKARRKTRGRKGGLALRVLGGGGACSVGHRTRGSVGPADSGGGGGRACSRGVQLWLSDAHHGCGDAVEAAERGEARGGGLGVGMAGRGGGLGRPHELPHDHLFLRRLHSAGCSQIPEHDCKRAIRARAGEQNKGGGGRAPHQHVHGAVGADTAQLACAQACAQPQIARADSSRQSYQRASPQTGRAAAALGAVACAAERLPRPAPGTAAGTGRRHRGALRGG